MRSMLIGVISDTHGLIRPEALTAFRGVEVVFHGGDIGASEVLKALEGIAPVMVVRGNCDRDNRYEGIPLWRIEEAGEKRFLLVHDVKELKNIDEPVDVVITGHSHQPRVYEKDGVLYMNPGSAGPRRFKLPVTVGRIRVEKGILIPEVIPLL
ncbi:MAG TPA: metallophosphoesterase family protein [Bacillota bacterium]|nr:metallophosphoesterase family protein [Bacillota bacterium]